MATQSKTNRTGRGIGIQKSHFCPECDGKSQIVMRMPGRTIWGRCSKGHSHRKSSLILK